MSVVSQPASGRAPILFDRFAALAGSGAILLMTARFGRSPVREAASHLRARHRDLDFRPSWRLFANLVDWGERWGAEQHSFAAGLILSAAGDPVVERAVGRCLADLYQLGRPLLWGVSSDRIRWRPQFAVSRNGWPPEWFPYPASTYARLAVAPDSAEFEPRFDPILFTSAHDFFVSRDRLSWLDALHQFDALDLDELIARLG